MILQTSSVHFTLCVCALPFTVASRIESRKRKVTRTRERQPGKAQTGSLKTYEEEEEAISRRGGHQPNAVCQLYKPLLEEERGEKKLP